MTADEVLMLLQAGGRLAAEPGVQAAELDPVVARLVRRDTGVDSDGRAQQVLTEALPRLWEGGWQPADVVHVARRKVSQRGARLVAAVVAAEAGAAAAAPPEAWAAQLAALPTGHRSVTEWWRGERIEPAAAWRDVLRVIGLFRALPRLEQLLPPPSGWSAALWPVEASGSETDGKVLHRIRSLLAKAESTEFTEEAEALTAKAQSLMARHAIDTAVLAQRGDGSPAGVVARRLHLDDPHTEAKAAVVQAVGTANGVRVVLLPTLGIATLVGFRDDVDLVELLVTSLLLQAARALADAAHSGGARARSTPFRRGFLYSFAQRLEERLTQARDQATAEARVDYGAELAPVLAARSAAVDRAVEELFPSLRRRGGSTVDPAGWHAGRRAADQADLGSNRRALPSTAGSS
ncbi:DUF2786 domain-containing protein [Modestobacter sp. VKM Ac-2983]|uniref:DUF2786 domain-containing protein n=1 Tax=Modestobacter sp. VKM Ac-2983 TaxID=3004137 RepID=UPI0022AB9DAD|nr:DUF2786 domain-containing protein [Modestobacter sp. VKM Ac-2983]MCZ2804478.1 DUF2786 domain-containing protein [Modestobacter sp. VKM Ac-2983]